jgi:TonB family protein
MKLSRLHPSAKFRFLALALATAVAAAGAADGDTPSTTSPRPTRTVSPVHPIDLLKERVSGEASIECVVQEDGTVGEVRVASASHPAFGEAALAAVQQWAFQPGEREGKPVSVKVTIPFNFELPPEDPLEVFAGRKVFVDLEGEVVPAQEMPGWPMPKQLLVPNYPEELRGSGKRGKAVVSVIIDRKGRVVNPQIVKTTWPEFAAPALAAAVSLEFPPQLGRDRKPVNVSMDLQFDFSEGDRGPKPRPAPEAKK